MTMRSRGALLAAITAGSLIAASVGAVEAADTRPPDDSAASAVDDVDREAEFRWANSFGHTSFDPHRSPATSSDASFMRPVYDRLLTLVNGADGVEIGPQLATSYEIADDGLSISFELRDDVTFHDGSALTSDAVRANIERAKDPESTVSSLLTAVESVEVVDDTHVVFHLGEPNPALPYSLAADTIGMIVNPAAFDTDLTTTPAGSGPFTLVSAERDAEVVYERWDDHWDPDAALVKRLTIATVADANARLNGLRSGDLDATFLASPLDQQSQELVDEGYHWVQSLAPINNGIMLNSSMEPFGDVRVRQAVSMAMNRQGISEELLGGIAPPVYQAFSPGYLGHDPALDVDPYDPEAARALVEEAGATGATVTMLTMTTSPYEAIAQIAQEALGEIGLEVVIEAVSPTEGIPTWREGGYAAFVGTILAEPEPSLTLDRAYLGGDNLAEPPAELVDMATAALTLQYDSAEREAAYQEISAYLVEDPVHVPLVQFSTVVVARPGVVNAADIAKVVIGKLDFRGVGVSTP